MRRMLLILLGFVIIGIAIRSVNSQLNPNRNIRYGDDSRNLLDLYLPEDVQNFPVVMFVSGGGWKSSDKNWVGNVGHALAAQGIGVVTVDHRLVPKVQYAGQVADLAQAFAWIQAHIGEYGGDVNRIYIGGHSAGGHLIAMLGTDERFLDEVGASLDDVAGIITVSGVMQLDDSFAGSSELVPDSDIAREEASPITYVKPDLPPFLLLFAQNDSTYLQDQSRRMYEALEAAGVSTELDEIPNRDHYSIITDFSAAEDVMLTWLSR